MGSEAEYELEYQVMTDGNPQTMTHGAIASEKAAISWMDRLVREKPENEGLPWLLRVRGTNNVIMRGGDS